MHLVEVLRERLPEFRPVLYSFLVVIVPSSVTLAIGLANLGPLRAALSTPWGVVTAIFVHSDASHYSSNMIALALLGLVFTMLNLTFDRAERKRRAWLYALTTFVAAVVAFGVFILTYPTSEGAFGASGVVYAAIGIVTIFAGINSSLHLLTAWRDWRVQQVAYRSLFWAIANLAFFAIFFFLILASPAEFLGVGRANFLSHGAATFVSIFIVVPYTWWWAVVQPRRDATSPPAA